MLQYISRRDETTNSKTLGALDRENINLEDQDDLKRYTTTRSAQKVKVIVASHFKRLLHPFLSALLTILARTFKTTPQMQKT